jgi:hypothetical protein
MHNLDLLRVRMRTEAHVGRTGRETVCEEQKERFEHA